MSPTTTSGLCLCGGPMGDHYPSAHPAPHASPLCRCGHALNMHDVCGQYDGGCGVDGCRCSEFERAPVVDSAPLLGSRAAAQAECDRVNALSPGPLPTTLAQPTGRRAELIYELLSWLNRAPVEQVEALTARTRNPSPIALVYIAGPYTGEDAWQTERNVRRAEELAYEVEALGACAVCPHSNTRYVDKRTPYERKIQTTLEMMRRCDAVLFTDDWRRSSGARGENAEAVQLGMPCFESLSGLRGWLSARGKRDGGA